MINITVNNTKTISCEKGANLFNILCDNGFIFPRNCGGNGYCNKCRVLILEPLQEVSACKYLVHKDISIFVEETSSSSYSTDSTYSKEKSNSILSQNSVSVSELGVAVDVGTTSIAIELIDLENGAAIGKNGFLNPQAKYGGDVISRIKKGESQEGLNDLKNILLSKIYENIVQILKEENISSNIDLKQIVFSGNTAMLSILQGYSTKSLGSYPFNIKVKDKAILDAPYLFQEQNYLKGTKAIFFPCLSAFIGGDIIGGATALAFNKLNGPSILIDLGTNGEIICGNGNHFLATSTACGPAFENSLKAGNYASNILDLISLNIKRGLINKNGVIAPDFFETGIDMGSGNIIHMDLIRQIQLAKSAICTGIVMLLNKMRLKEEDLENVYLSGGLGCCLNIETAVSLGLIPEKFKDKIVVSGNTSLIAAKKALVDDNFIEEMEILSKHCEVMNLAKTKDFNELYIKHLDFMTI